MYRFRHTTLLALSTCLALSVLEHRELSGSDSVGIAISNIMEQIRPVLEKKKLFSVNIGRFESVQNSSAGPEIQTKLKSAFDVLDDFKIDPIDYQVKLTGRLEKHELANALAVRLVVQIFDSNNRPIGQFAGGANAVSTDILGQEAVPRLLAITGDTTGANSIDRGKRNKQNASQDPSVIKGTEVFAGENSPYSIELLVEATAAQDFAGVTAEKRGKRGNAFAEIAMGRTFRVALRNYSDQEAAVNLTLDGISSFAFSEVRQNTVYWLVPPATSKGPGLAIIRGWDKNDHESFEFETVDYPASAAKELKIEPNEDLGQICAQFSDALPAGPNSRAVGRGDVIKDEKKSEAREIGPLKSTIVIRYMRNQ